MDADGGGQTRLPAGKADNWAPAWSPDGRAVAFVSNRDKNDEVYLMDADGGGQTNLTRSPGTDENLPRWSPDGGRLVYTAQGHPATPAWMAINLGLAGILLQTTLLIGVILFAIRRWALPFGSLTLVCALSSLLIGFMRDQERLIPAAIVAGLLADLLLWRLQPTAARPNAVHLFVFAVPLVFHAFYFATLALTDG